MLQTNPLKHRRVSPRDTSLVEDQNRKAVSWETRGQNGRRYYYRKARTADGAVRSTYVGRGLRAAVEAEFGAVARASTAYDTAALRRFEADVDAADGSVRSFTADVRERVDAAMAEAGFRYHRGEWRRPRVDPDAY